MRLEGSAICKTTEDEAKLTHVVRPTWDHHLSSHESDVLLPSRFFALFDWKDIPSRATTLFLKLVSFSA